VATWCFTLYVYAVYVDLYAVFVISMLFMLISMVQVVGGYGVSLTVHLASWNICRFVAKFMEIAGVFKDTAPVTGFH